MVKKVCKKKKKQKKTKKINCDEGLLDHTWENLHFLSLASAILNARIKTAVYMGSHCVLVSHMWVNKRGAQACAGVLAADRILPASEASGESEGQRFTDSRMTNNHVGFYFFL